MRAKILDGKKLALQLRQELADNISAANAQYLPTLSIVQIGNDGPSITYVRNKIKACEKAGISARHCHLPEDISHEALLDVMRGLASDNSIHGILLQLPLPSHLSPQFFARQIPPEKDVDGLHPYNLGLLVQKQAFFRPCTAFGIIRLLQQYDIPLMGQKVVVVNASSLVGRPLAMELLNQGATVTVCNSKTKSIETHLQQADLVISGTGCAHRIPSAALKEGVVVVDVGVYRQADGGFIGDFIFNEVSEIASWITPVPGGVGPMTIAILLENVWLAYLHRNSANEFPLSRP